MNPENDLNDQQNQILETPLPEQEQNSSDFLSKFGANPVKETEQEKRAQRQHEKIYQNVSAYMRDKGIDLPKEEVPENLKKFGAVPVEEEEGDLTKYGKMAGREVFSRALGTPADIIDLADMAYNWIQGEGQGGLLGQGLSWLAEKVHPATTHGIKEAIDISTGGKYAPKSSVERVGLGTLDFMTMGGMLGALKKGRILKELGAATGASTLPELSDDPKTKAVLALTGDILGRNVSSQTAMKEAFGNIASIPQKVKNLPTKAIKAAEELGLVPSAGMTTGSAFIQKMEKHGSGEALKYVSDDMIGKLEDITASRFTEPMELGEKVAETAGQELEKGLTEREIAYESLGNRFGDTPIETPTANKVFESYQTSATITPETKKALEATVGKIFESGETIPKAAEELHPESLTKLELGRKVQSNITEKATTAHKEASKKYEILENLSERIGVNENKMNKFMETLGEIEETGAPDYLKTKFNTIKTKSAQIADRITQGKKIPASALIKLEQQINDAIKWDAQHDHTKLLIPLKKEAENVIQGSLTGNSLLRYRDAKKSWRKYYEDFLDPDAVRKMRFTQKPEEIATLVKNPSYFEQLTKQVGEKESNALKRHIVEEIGTSKNAVKEFEEYRGVFGKEYDRVLDSMKRAQGKEAANVANLANAVEKIDERLSKTIGQKEKAALEKMRQSIVQDMKKAHPDSAGFISDQFGKLSPETKMQRDITRAFADGDPEKFLSSLKTKEDLNQLKKAVGNIPKGKELYDSARRMKLSDMINKEVIKDGQLQFDKLANVADRLLKDSFGRELLGPENIKLFENIQEYSKEITRAAKTFQTNLQLVSKHRHAGGMMATGAALMSLLHGNLGIPAAVFGFRAANRLMTKILTDPVVKRQILDNFHKTIPQIAGKSMTLDRAYKIARPMMEWGLPEVASYKED